MRDEIDEVAYRFSSISPWDLPEPKGMPDNYPGGIRAWFYAQEMRRLLGSGPMKRTETAIPHVVSE